MTKTKPYVQAYINNISFPNSLEELADFMENGLYDLEKILQNESVEWTAPKWTKIGDIVFFMHAKTSIQTIRNLEKQLNNLKQTYSEYEFKKLWNWLQYGKKLYSLYGGKIFAIGKVFDNIIHDDNDKEFYDIHHWQSRIYASINDFFILEEPIALEAFKDFISISRQSAITSVLGKDFDRLIKLISLKNKLPSYYKNATAMPINLANISKANWLNITSDYRRTFFLEIQFRSYYVDYLLKELGDIKTFYRECRCQKIGIPDSFVDNLIKINNKYLPVEVKLSVSAEKDICRQVSKYCNNTKISNDKITIESDKLFSNNCLVIDTEKIYIYFAKTNEIIEIFDLEKIKNIEDIKYIRNIIINLISNK